MAAAETAKPSAAHAASLGGRSTYDYATPIPPTYATSSPRKHKLRLVTSSTSTASSPKPNVYSAGASPASSTTYFPPRSDSRVHGAKMSSGSVGKIPAVPGRSGSRHAKLHKRGSSGSSLPGSLIPATSSALAQTSPMPAYDEAYTPTSTTPTGSMPKIRPYLRKISTKDDSDQGRLDLSKSISENHALSGLGIAELNPRSVSDVSFTHTAKRSHARTTSGDSALSTASNSLRPSGTSKTFVHPMRQTPRPYTPPHGHSFDYSSSLLNDEERNESDDVLTDDDFRLGAGFRSRRSVSISSTPIIAPTPLSQSHTASDLGLGMVPKITNSSQTNLSIKSNRSGKSSKSRPAPRSRRNTERSFDTAPTSVSARTSLDKAFSFASVGGGGGGRRSDPDPLTRDQRIEAARRKFDEQEARKDRKAEERVVKREERVRRKSEASERSRVRKASAEERVRKAGLRGELGVDDADVRPPPDHAASLSEKRVPQPRVTRRVSETKPQGPWARFSVWLKTRLLSCGGKG